MSYESNYIKYPRIYEVAINKTTDQGYLFDEPEYQWDDVSFRPEDFETIYDIVYRDFDSMAEKFVDNMAEYVEKSLRKEYKTLPVKSIKDFFIDEQINSETITALIETHELTDKDMIKIINSAIKKKVKFQLEYDENEEEFPKEKGLTVHIEEPLNTNVSIKFNLDKRYNHLSTNFTLLDFFRKIDLIPLEDIDAGKQLEELIEYTFEDYIGGGDWDSTEIYKTVNDIQSGKKPKFAQLHLKADVEGYVKFILTEKAILPFILDHVFKLTKSQQKRKK